MMKILMVSLDGSILEPNSNSAGRMKDYGSICDELHILVLKGAGDRVKISENVFAYPCGSSRIAAIFSATGAGKKILSAGGQWIVTSQDPFETGFIAWRLAKKIGAPFEIQLHGDFYGNKYWKRERILNFFRFYLGKFILRRAASVRVVSRRIAESLSFVRDKNIFEVPIFSTMETVLAEKNKKPSEFLTLLAVGNQVPVKNHKLLIEVFAEIKKELPEAKLVIVGEGPERKALELLTAHYSLQTNVELTGHQNNLAKYYQSADIFVHPSLYEGWGRAVVEAAAYGLPIIMTDVGLAGEIIKDNESGLIVAVNNKEALKNAILKLAKDEALRKRLGEAARQAISGLDKKEDFLNKIKKAWENIFIQPQKNVKNYFSKNKIIFCILFFAIVLRLAYFGIILKNFGDAGFYITKNGDSAEYYNAAKNILERGIFSIADAAPFVLENFRTPGYPAFIIIFYKIIPSVAWVIFWQNIIFVGFIFAVYLFVKNNFSRIAALIMAAFLSFEPSIIYLNNQLLSENIFTIAVFAAFVFSLGAIYKRSYFAAISGLCLAAALYLRPIGQYLPVIFGIYYLAAVLARKISWKKFILIILLSTASFGVAIFPWLARNKKEFGRYEMASSSSITLSRYSLAIASNLKENDGWIGPSAAGPLVYYIASHPFVFGKVYIMSLTMFFGGDSYLLVFDRLWPGLENQRLQTYWPRTFPEMYKYLWGHKDAEAAIFWLGKIVRAAIISLFLAGVYFGFKNKKNQFILFGMALLIFYLTFAAGAVSYTRFRFAVEPYIYTFVGIAIVNIFYKKRKNNSKDLLIITQKVDENDPVLGFFHRWLEKISQKTDKVYVIANEVGEYRLPSNVSVYSLGKENGRRKISRYLKFIFFIFSLTPKVSGAFIHMCPEYALIAGPILKILRKKSALWYVHRSLNWKLKMAEKFVDKIATTTKESCRLESKKVEIWGHGIDVDFFKPAEKGEHDDFLKIVSVGRISPIKNYEILVGAAKILKNNGVEKFEADIFGAPVYKADKEYSARLKDEVSKSGLENIIRFRGAVPYNEMPVALSDADLLVNLCPAGGLDKAVLEAASEAVPVMVSNNGFREFLGTYQNRFLFKENDAEDLAEKIKDFKNSSDGREIGLYLRGQVEKYHNLDKLTDKIIMTLC